MEFELRYGDVMLEKSKKRDKNHLINLIRRRSNSTPNFALLLGAGASFSSGIKTSKEMISEWHNQLYIQSENTDTYDEWLKQQEWYEDDEEYSILFEKVYDQRSQRRIYIEECVDDAKPSWGYIYLANLIAQKFFNVIFTPNFDDLLNDACFLYTDQRPIVCAHDSSVIDIRVTSARPKIIKLHGDFLYDSIKNTIEETEILEENMREKFKQFVREYGLIITGYGGNDKSIMDILDTTTRSGEYFPNGLYWCVRQDTNVNKKVKRLLHHENVYLVEIEGFDEFMAELHEGLNLKLPESVTDPYKATTSKLNNFIILKEDIKNEIIKKDIDKLEIKIKDFEKIISEKGSEEEKEMLIAYAFLGQREYERNNYNKAINYFDKALLQNPTSLIILNKLFFSYIYIEKFDKALEISEKMIQYNEKDIRGYLRKGTALVHQNKVKEALEFCNIALDYAKENSKQEASVLVNRSNAYLLDKQWKKALIDAEKSYKLDNDNSAALLNKCIAMKNLGNIDEMEDLVRDFLPKIKTNYFRASAYGLLKDKKNMLKELKISIKQDIGKKISAKFDPDFSDYRKDPDFKELINN